MGDTENAQQPSKKRAALKELSRDNPGLDDDEEEEDPSAMESGTFKTASEEVLASRRIVRVKRRDPSAAALAPASNPFAGIRLVPSTAPAPAPAPATTAAETNKPLPDSNSTPSDGKQETQDDEISDSMKETDGDKSEAIDTVGKQEIQDCGVENKIDNERKITPEKEGEKEKEKAKDDNDNSKTDKGTDCLDKDSGVDQSEKEEKEGDGNEGTDKNIDSGALSSFQQHSSSKNAFTGLASTGFSTSSFSFGLVSQEGSSLSAQSSFSFGLPNNGNSSLSITTKSLGTATAFPSKQEVTVETGEENEKAAFTADSVMFEYIEGGWKERGKGEVKVNISTSNSNKARLVMRSKGNYRLILNASLYPEMKLASMDKKGITFVCVNSISEANNGLSTFALKFKNPTVVDEFRAIIEEHKRPKIPVFDAAAPPLNSPEG